MAGFPWSELGLDGPADERAIRRAYAARLKIVRPDLDAAGFQRLVQARDAALRAIEHTARRALLRQTPPSDPAPQREAAAPESRAPQPDSPDMAAPRKQAPRFIIGLGPSNSTADTDPPDDKPPVEMPPPLEIERAAGSASSPAARQPPPVSQPRLVTADVDPPQSPPTVTEPGAKPPSTPPAVVDQARAVAGPDTVSVLLSAFIEAWSQNQSLPPVPPILKLLGEQSIVARQNLETEALRAVASLLDQDLFDPNMSKARQQAARSLILGLDDDYAWTSNDRRLYQMMPQAAADQIGRLLRVVREWEKTGLAPNFAPPRQVKTRQQKSASWVLGGVGLLLFAIIKGLSISTPKSPASTYTAAVVDQVSAPVFFNQGVAYDNKNQFDSAIQMYDAAIRSNPNYALAFYNRGLDYANKGEFDRAIRDYDQAIRLNPGDPGNFVSRGVAYNGKELYDRAIQDYDQAIRLRPDYALAFVDRGIAYADKNEYDRAIQDYDQAIRVDPNDPDAWHNRGLAKQAKGDTAGGDADIAKARQLNSPLPPASSQARQ
jgi:tetratricopeptide (TPR) repeat protein